MDYSKMTPNRFGKMMEYKKLYNNIKAEIIEQHFDIEEG